MTARDTADKLRASGVLSGGGVVDTAYFASLLATSRSQVREGLAHLSASGAIAREQGWQCSVCGSENRGTSTTCFDCGEERTGEAKLIDLFVRKGLPTTRDPAALFLIHGMNTLGDWQQSLAWRVQLLYGYSLPTFVFKFGVDRISPFTRRAQRRRVAQLASAVREAQADLVAAGRVERCDVVAHSFGTLLLTQLLSDPLYNDIVLGRVILTGAIARSDVDWSGLLERERIEAVLNHRGGRDVWVRLAPWAFPEVSASGYRGFAQASAVRDHYSADFAHSDFFTRGNFDSVIRDVWTPFLTGNLGQSADENRVSGAPEAVRLRKYWIGRVVVSLAALLALGVAIGVFVLTCSVAHHPWMLRTLPYTPIGIGLFPRAIKRRVTLMRTDTVPGEQTVTRNSSPRESHLRVWGTKSRSRASGPAVPRAFNEIACSFSDRGKLESAGRAWD